MVENFNMKKIMVPFAADNKGEEGPVSIFLSADYDTNKDKCMVIIQGTGKIEAGYLLFS